MKSMKIFSVISLIFFSITQSCQFKEKGIILKNYNELYRSQFHFSPKANWMNDPNGMVYYAGEYHLFYQHYPDNTVWGPMHWGHAVSKDLIHWQHLPIALYPDSLGYIFSGSAVVDIKNTSGLGTLENPAMVAIFTYHNPKLEKGGSNTFQYQGMAYSLDKGRTWTKFKNNPVLKNPGIHDFRDPKVFWNTSIGKWIMVLAAGDRVKFYSSPDLIQWTFESDFGMNLGAHGGVWECPDLIKLPVNNSKDSSWVLFVSINPGGPNGGSATQYFTGSFDGHKFIPDNSAIRWVDYGKDNYAGVTWSNIPSTDGRILSLGWMSNWQYAEKVPTVNWRSANTVPRELRLIKENNSLQLISIPIKELATLRSNIADVKINSVQGIADISGQIPFEKYPSEMIIRFNTTDYASGGFPKRFGIKLSNSRNEEILVGYDNEKKQFFVDRTRSGNVGFSKDFPGLFAAPWELKEKSLELHLFLDESSVELFGQQGCSVLTDLFFPTEKYNQVAIFSEGGSIRVNELKVWRLNSIW